MRSLRLLIPVILFSVVSLWLFVLSIVKIYEAPQGPSDWGEETPAERMSFFRGMTYFRSQGQKPSFSLQSHEMIWDMLKKTQRVVFPKGWTYTDDSQRVDFSANAGKLLQASKSLFLSGSVEIQTTDSRLTGNRCEYHAKNDQFAIQGNVKSEHISPSTQDKIYIDSESAEAYPARQTAVYTGHVKGKIKRSRIYEPSVDFATQQLAIDLKKSHIQLDGSVFLEKQNLTANSLRGEIFLENYNKKLKYYALYDDVKIKERVTLKDGSKITRKAFSEKLEGYASSDKIVLTGSPRVLQGTDLIKGNVITLIQNNETVEVDDAASKFIIKE